MLFLINKSDSINISPDARALLYLFEFTCNIFFGSNHPDVFFGLSFLLNKLAIYLR